MYLYSFEDGSFGVSVNAPLEGDKRCIEQGTLSVLKISVSKGTGTIKVQEVTASGNLTEVHQTFIESDETGEHHCPMVEDV